MSAKRLPTYFISHGGGPWPWMKAEQGDAYAKLDTSLADIARLHVGQPRAALVITAHWEAPEFEIQAAPRPGMIYDYGGFPQHTYSIQYPAPGSPELATRVHELIQAAGLPANLDPTRGYDHGTFVPLYAMYPDAKMPIVQLSIQEDYDPELHLRLGRALAPLRDEGILILGSGLSYHNLRNFGPGAKQASGAFDQWLAESLALPPEARERRILDWALAPAARLAHPREDHLVPLFAALGAARLEPATRVYHESDFVGGVSVSSFRFGALN